MGKRKVVIRVNEKNEVEILSQEGVMGLTLDEKKKGFLFVRKYYFNQLVEKERKNVLLKCKQSVNPVFPD